MTEEVEAKRFESLASVVGKALFRSDSKPTATQEMTITRPMSPKLSQSNRRQEKLKPTEEVEFEETKKQFKAKKLDQNILEGLYVIPETDKVVEPIEFKEFNLSSAKNASKMKSRLTSEEKEMQ